MLPLFFLFFLIINTLEGKPLQLEIHAKSAILINPASGAVLFEKDADLPSHPASITKIATALYVLENFDPGQTTVVGKESLRKKPSKGNRDQMPPYWLEEEGTSLGLNKDEEISLDALLHGMMLCSGNDAANVLGEFASGSLPQFIDNLNQTLSQIGCNKTYFCNPHGLHHSEHVTTARDMALITARALKIPKFRDIVAKRSYKKPKTNKSRETELKQSNRLLNEGPFFYSKAIGVKTGFTSQAKNTLVAAAEHEGRTLIAVLLGCEKREDRYIDAIALFEAAFAEKKVRSVLIEPFTRYQKNLEGAKTPLSAVPVKAVAVDFYPAEEPLLRAEIRWKIPPLPIQKGALVGEIHLYDKEKKLEAVPLFAEHSVEQTWKSFFRRFSIVD